MYLYQHRKYRLTFLILIFTLCQFSFTQGCGLTGMRRYFQGIFLKVKVFACLVWFWLVGFRIGAYYSQTF